MPTLSEFTLSLQLRRDEENGKLWTVFRFSTLREFRSFRYEIQVDDTFDAAARGILFQIRGVRAPANLMPSYGAARREICYANLTGTYTVEITGAKQTGSFSFNVRGEKIRLIDTAGTDFVQVSVLTDVEVVRN